MAQALPTRQLTTAALLALAAACGAQQQNDEDPRALVDRVLARCHGPFLGQLGRSVVTIREREGAPAITIACELPERMRIERGGETLIWRNGKGWRCAPGAPAKDLAEAEALEVRQWRALVRALALDPLARAQKLTRQGPSVLALILEGGETWRLELDAAGLRPLALSGPDADVTFKTFVETDTTRIPRHVVSKELGERHATFETCGARFDELVFTDVGTKIGTTQERGNGRETGAEHKPRKPEVQSVRTTLVLVLADPGDWKERFASLDKEGLKLHEQGQMPTGLPIFWRDEDGPRIGIPFEPDPERGSRPFAQTKDQTVMRRTRHDALVVYPPPGSLDDALASTALATFAKEQGLEVKGTLRAVPYVNRFSSAGSKAQDVSKLEVRLELPVLARRR